LKKASPLYVSAIYKIESRGFKHSLVNSYKTCTGIDVSVPCLAFRIKR